jgi:hypothetical protein
MKTLNIKLLTLTLLGFAPIFIQAQFAKGDWLVEGNFANIGINNYDYKTTTSTSTIKSDSKGFSFSIYPRAGYFVTDNIVVGTTLGLSFSNSKGTYFATNGKKSSDYTSKYGYFDFLPYIRYYFNSKSPKTRFYGQVGGGISTTISTNSKYTYFNTTTGVITSTFEYNYPKKYSNTILEGIVGLNQFISGNVALNAYVGYRNNSSKETANYTNTVGGVSTTSPNTEYANKSSNISFGFGFNMILKGKKMAKK